jgi:virginiamycin B lyase
MSRSGWCSHLTVFLTTLITGVGLLSLSIAPVWAAAGTVTEFPVKSSPSGITAGPDGNLWFTLFLGNAIERITPSGAVSGFAIPTANSRSEGITVGPDGNVWFAETLASKIGRVTTS